MKTVKNTFFIFCQSSLIIVHVFPEGQTRIYLVHFKDLFAMCLPNY